MGDSDSARGTRRRRSFKELDDPVSSTATAHSSADEERISLTDMELVDGDSALRAHANDPPALPEVGTRKRPPAAPLSVRRASVRPGVRTPVPPSPSGRPMPPPKREPTPESSPMIGGDGWIGADRISKVDFSAVLSSRPPTAAPTITGSPDDALGSAMGPPSLEPPAMPHAAPAARQVRIGILAVVGALLLCAVGGIAYWLGKQEAIDSAAISAPRDLVSGETSAPDVNEEPRLNERLAEASDLRSGDLPDEQRSDEQRSDEQRSDEQRSDEQRSDEQRSAGESADERISDEWLDRESIRGARTLATGDAPDETSAMSELARDVDSSESGASRGQTGTMATSSTMASAAPLLPAQPSREDVQRALSGVRGAVAQCMGGQHATVRVRVAVRGSGRVTTATVQDPYWARPPTGSCIARAVREAEFPAFSEETFVVLYPFQL